MINKQQKQTEELMKKIATLEDETHHQLVKWLYDNHLDVLREWENSRGNIHIYIGGTDKEEKHNGNICCEGCQTSTFYKIGYKRGKEDTIFNIETWIKANITPNKDLHETLHDFFRFLNSIETNSLQTKPIKPTAKDLRVAFASLKDERGTLDKTVDTQSPQKAKVNQEAITEPPSSGAQNYKFYTANDTISADSRKGKERN